MQKVQVGASWAIVSHLARISARKPRNSRDESTTCRESLSFGLGDGFNPFCIALAAISSRFAEKCNYRGRVHRIPLGARKVNLHLTFTSAPWFRPFPDAVASVFEDHRGLDIVEAHHRNISPRGDGTAILKFRVHRSRDARRMRVARDEFIFHVPRRGTRTN
jgi:hypothetical protein